MKFFHPLGLLQQHTHTTCMSLVSLLTSQPNQPSALEEFFQLFEGDAEAWIPA